MDQSTNFLLTLVEFELKINDISSPSLLVQCLLSGLVLTLFTAFTGRVFFSGIWPGLVCFFLDILSNTCVPLVGSGFWGVKTWPKENINSNHCSQLKSDWIRAQSCPNFPNFQV